MTNPAAVTVPGDLTDPGLADAGKRRIEWAFAGMPVLQAIRKQFIKDQPFAGVPVAACLPITPSSANFVITLRDGGATVAVCAADGTSTHDDVVASLVRDYSVRVNARHGEDEQSVSRSACAVLETGPHVTVDYGARLLTLLRNGSQDHLRGVVAGTEQMPTGIRPLRTLARQVGLEYPVMDVGRSRMRQLFDSRLGTGQTSVDAILRITHALLAGMKLVLVGYGSRGRGIAERARGMGATLIVTEIDPVRAVEAAMEGCRVMPITEAAAIGDIFVTVTGSRNVIGREVLERLKDGAILCNAGHLPVEIDLESLARISTSRREIRDMVDEFRMKDGRRIYLLAQGWPISQAVAGGHPATVMDMSFAIQALAVEYLLKNHESLTKDVHGVPDAIDRQVAKCWLDAMGVAIDKLTIEQEEYLANWSEGN